MTTPRVFVVQESDLNLSKATSFGQLITLLPKTTHITLATQPVIRTLKEKLKDFNDADYILPLGDPAAIILTGLIASENNRGKIKVLKWDNYAKLYYEVVVDVHDRPRGI